MHWVLLPGLDGTGILFQPFLSVLPPGIQTTVISYLTDVTLNYQELVHYVRERLPKQERYILVAESFSGPIAITIASQNPANLQAIVLCATFIDRPVAWAISVIVKSVRYLLFGLLPPRFVIRYFLLGFYAPNALFQLFYKAIGQVHPKVLAERVKLVLEVDTQEVFSQLTLPVLFLIARQDRLISNPLIDKNLRTWQNIQIEGVDAPHLMLQVNPEEAIRAIFRFKEEHLGRGEVTL